MEAIAQFISDATGKRFTPQELIATSPYVRHDKIREWVGYLMLHRITNGLEMAHGVEFASAHVKMMREIIDKDRLNELLRAERRTNPAVDAWFREKFVSTYTMADLAKYPETSLGGVYYRRLQAIGVDDVSLDMGVKLPNETELDLWVIRGLQLHDLEHILGGGGFNLVGEIMPSSMRCGSLFKHLGPEAASLLSMGTYLLNIGQLCSAMLYTPQAYPVILDRFYKAWTIGQTSGPYFLAKLEDYFHMSLADARIALDINNVDERDTEAESVVALAEPEYA